VSGRLILIRHGEPVGHAGRCIGHHDTELAPSAIEPLQRLSRTNRVNARLIIASDLRRAAGSAAIVARAWNAELRFDPRLRELSFGEWEGRPWDEIARDDADAIDVWGRDWTAHSAPGGETGTVFAARVGAALREATELTASADVAVVSHAGWIRVATTILLAEPLASAFDRSIDYARAAVFNVSGARPVLEHWNVERFDAPRITNASAPPQAPSSARP